ncbi:glycine cleavage system protein R [Alteromonas aestuariivivens]|uniref:Glycine cleavage system transcriptional repressor n=1 Tax=Alteromonas aestuariivivens TaxID=1938339 RepID=A0A3D8MCC1_9ALTE|nr:ACT domain-containing protein [Alteromonas aestuariivivens]RDV28146.1 glycine cleavage system protein R [Alteromonas aestuariivivens]
MQSIVITIMGKDKPGLVDAVAKCVYQHQGNWQGSSFARMAGMFTGFVEIHVPENSHQALVRALDSIPDLTVQSVTVAHTPSSYQETLAVEVMGNDKPGIVQELTNILNQFNLNIESFDSRCESAPNWGSLMFKARAVIGVPEDFDSQSLQSALESISNDLVVDIGSSCQ